MIQSVFFLCKLLEIKLFFVFALAINLSQIQRKLNVYHIKFCDVGKSLELLMKGMSNFKIIS